MTIAPATERLAPSRDLAPRRLAIVLSTFSTGGAERAASLLAAHWSADGHRVSLLTLDAVDRDFYEIPADVERIGLGVLGSSSNKLAGLGRATRRALALRRALGAVRPGVVLSLGDRTNVLTLLATAGLGIRTFVSERTDPRFASTGPHWKLARRLLYPAAAGVVVQTESVATWARRRWRRVTVIPNFVERPRRVATPAVDHGPRTLVAMGRLAPVKGFDLLCRAFARIAPAHPAWTLVIYGEGPERSVLERLVAQSGVAGRVLLPGRVTEPEAALAAGHAFALPSRHEGFPNALLEAMACGLPVVAFDCPSGPSEIVIHEQDGLLVPPQDVEAFAAALHRVLGSADVRERLGANARRVVDRFSPARVCARWGSLLGLGGRE
jgi:glycosyltransferase involved in cell wall biosynthesis